MSSSDGARENLNSGVLSVLEELLSTEPSVFSAIPSSTAPRGLATPLRTLTLICRVSKPCLRESGCLLRGDGEPESDHLLLWDVVYNVGT